MDATDAELLAAFARNRNEDAFRELLRRHLGMVFATARRLVNDPHAAEEITQTVFQLFAEKAGTLDARQPLAGWLYHTSRHHALHRLRSEGRRRQREQLAVAMNPAVEFTPPPQLIAELEDALTELESEERDALVLRFLEDRQLREVGHELGVSEEAARKRVSRALDRLRDVFARRGITASTGAITVALLGQAGVGVPAGLGATITTAVLGGTTVAAATTALITESTATTMNLFNFKTAAAILGAAAVTGTTTYLVQEREVDQLRTENTALNQTHAKLASDQQESLAMIQLRDEQIERLKRDVADLPRLRGEVDRLKREKSQTEETLASLADASRLVEELKEKNSELTSKLQKSLVASWVFERDQWQHRGQETPIDAFQTFLWAWGLGRNEALKDLVLWPGDIVSEEDRAGFLYRVGPREQLPSTRATRVKIFWQDGSTDGNQVSLVALTESVFVRNPLETREHLVRWELRKVGGRWKVVSRHYM